MPYICVLYVLCESSPLLPGYLLISDCLEDLRLPNNAFSKKDCLVLLWAISQCGAKGVLKCVHVEGQQPPLTKEEMLCIVSDGMKVGVRVLPPTSVDVQEDLSSMSLSTSTLPPTALDGGTLTPKELLLKERAVEVTLGEDVESREIRRVRDLLQDMKRTGNLAKAAGKSFVKVFYI